MANNRRQAAKDELGFVDKEEEIIVSEALDKEALRRQEKEERRQELLESDSYQVISTIAKWADKYFLDPIIGFFPVVGDTISAAFGLPFIYFALTKVRSIPLALAVTYNYLVDLLLGCIPFFIGDVIDFFHRAHIKNMQLITHFVDDDKEAIKEVNAKAIRVAILIVLLCYLIYKVVGWINMFADWVASFF